MNIHRLSNPYSLAWTAQEAIDEWMGQRSNPLICVASGSSPEALYQRWVDAYRNGEQRYQKWNYVGLDEWWGLGKDDAGSCADFLLEKVFSPLQLNTDQYTYFNGKATDPNEECARIEQYVKAKGGIHLAVLGLGMNGHIGLNEPGSTITDRTRTTALSQTTIDVAQKYFTIPTMLSTGITLGIANLLEAEHLVILVQGKHKAPIVKEWLTGAFNENLPASLLTHHENLHVFLDQEAASLI